MRERERERERGGGRLALDINSPFVAFSVAERNVERERGGDKAHKQIARTIVCDLSRREK
jgi:hypothetical protein